MLILIIGPQMKTHLLGRTLHDPVGCYGAVVLGGRWLRPDAPVFLQDGGLVPVP